MNATDACGTDRGYQRHKHRKTTACSACLAAHRDYVKEQRAANPSPPRQLAPCGSPSAYRRHIRRGETACAECLAANRAEGARYARSRKRSAA